MRAFAPGRVNLIGDHVDYLGGPVLPMAIDLGTTIEAEPGGGIVRLVTSHSPTAAEFEIPVPALEDVPQGWPRLAAAVLREMRVERGFSGTVTSTVPIGAGLSSSTSFATVVALAAGFAGSLLDLCHLVLRAETTATGVPGGLMDQIAITHAIAGSALLIDCSDQTCEPVPLPEGAAVHVIHSGVDRRLAESPYAERRRDCAAAEREVGPLLHATPDSVAAIRDPIIRARARHAVTEMERVRLAAEASRENDAVRFGRLMVESHRSLRDDFEVSTSELDELVDQLVATPGVFGARLTGAGFGGCVVTLVDEAIPADRIGGWRVHPGGPARILATR